MKEFIELYNPEWKTEFESIKQIIQSELNDLSSEIEIEHVGSTSIPGLLAKPILDIDIIIKNKALLKSISLRLEKIGYKSKGEQGISGRFAFRQTSDFMPLTETKKKKQSHHLYVCYADSLALKNHLLFREILRNDKGLIESYSELKKSLTDNLKITREEYTTKKTNFIISVLTKAGLNEKELTEIANDNT
ncbi:MAG: GrpB family protein [Bacteroidota bacterium]|nr:GrpB family protein [Bacteroidota bacterium]